MRKIINLFNILMVISALFSGCKKEKKEEHKPDLCAEGTSIGKLNATIAGEQWCANSSLFANYADIMTISGMNQNTSTLTLELDDATAGTYEIREDRNHILYTSAGQSWRSTDDNPGLLVITSNDEANYRIQGTFSLTARNPIGGNISISGNFDVFYTE